MADSSGHRTSQKRINVDQVQAGEHRMSTDTGLLAHWKFNGDCRDSSGNGNHGINRGADLAAVGRDSSAYGAARFDGRAAHVEVPAGDMPALAEGDFTLSAWVELPPDGANLHGDILSKYDPVTRSGLNFGTLNFAGVTAAQAHHCNLHFGIDDGAQEPTWVDCGRPGNNLRVYSLAVYNGDLYTGTFEWGADEAGHMYRYAGGQTWEDCGSPDQSNTVASLAVFRGELYAGTSCYRAGGSALEDSPNKHPGGAIYRYMGDASWEYCGRLAGAESIAGMAVYNGELYAIPLYSQGVFRYLGGQDWEYCGTPGRRMMAITVFKGHLYGAGNEGGGVFRYDGGTDWTPCGFQEGVTQVYSFAAYRGELYVGTWPNGTVFRWDGQETWEDVGRLEDEKEVMAMAVYNGKLYAGTLPLANVYRYEGGATWTNTGQLDTTPDVKYRRVWSMAIFQGKLFGGTLPSGRVYSMEAGANVTYDRALAPGWRHLTAVRAGNQLRLYVDGVAVSTSDATAHVPGSIANDQPLRIGFGQHDHFNGSLADVRVYGRALSAAEIAALQETT
ncbi:MAG: LamG domain-containing protein [Chloroflexi bacterium]|nr:LamG domain-containing protein [Chloroflexota bacterium]